MGAARSAALKAPRPLRADAQRSRDSIVLAAHETFEAEGVLASLDGIALRAGVGNATLYRHFPTRDDLLAAVIQTSIAAALTEADELSRSLHPRGPRGMAGTTYLATAHLARPASLCRHRP